ncbi:MAG: YfcE family phosphodiesterase [Clostridia bacterium]|nr:YfcE family phosphodiesterase [Clostridia bacterium]
MRIIVFSDSHGRLHNCIDTLEQIGHVDHMIHLGDMQKDASDLGTVFPDVPITFVCGNGEIGAKEDYEKTITLGGKRLFLCHGHRFHVKNGLSVLAAQAPEADLVLFGHTHEPFDGFVDGVHLFNPGSISLPATGAPSCGIIDINNGNLSVSHWTK